MISSKDGGSERLLNLLHCCCIGLAAKSIMVFLNKAQVFGSIVSNSATTVTLVSRKSLPQDSCRVDVMPLYIQVRSSMIGCVVLSNTFSKKTYHLHPNCYFNLIRIIVQNVQTALELQRISLQFRMNIIVSFASFHCFLFEFFLKMR